MELRWSRRGQARDEVRAARLRRGLVEVAFALTALGVIAAPAVAAAGRLPDNRAYELVSEVDGNGSPVRADIVAAGGPGSFPTPLVAPSGDSALYFIVGSLPGMTGNGVAEEYRARRTSTGWQTQLWAPSGAQSELPAVGGVTPDHDFAFWSTAGVDRGDLGAGSLFVRRPDGSFDVAGQGSLGTDPSATGMLISPGARHIIFISKIPLEPNSPAVGKVGIYDRTPGGTDLVSVLPNGTLPTVAIYKGVSADGTSVAFVSSLVLYVRRGGVTVQVATGNPTLAGISDDGTRLFYVKSGNIFAFDVATQTTTQITTGGGAAMVNVSADGSHAYFVSPAQLDGTSGTLGAKNLYVWDGTAVRFIATLDPADVAGDVNLTNWASWVVAKSQPLRDPSRTTPDGHVMVFQSHAPLTGYDNAGHSEIFRSDDRDGSLTCISCKADGTPATADATLQTDPFADAQAPTSRGVVIPNVTADGKAVFFESDEALVPEDVGGTKDVYEWKSGRVSLISSGRSVANNYLYGMTPDGHDVMFTSQDELVPWRPTVGAAVLYDARVDGGFPAPPRTADCVEDGCQGPPTAAPWLPIATAVSGEPRNPIAGPVVRAAKLQITRVVGASTSLSVTVRAPGRGRLTGRGTRLRTVARSLARAGTYTIKLKLTPSARRSLRRHRALTVRARLSYRPASGARSSTTCTVRLTAPDRRRKR